MGGNWSSFNLRGREVSRKREQNRAASNIAKQNRYKQTTWVTKKITRNTISGKHTFSTSLTYRLQGKCRLVRSSSSSSSPWLVHHSILIFRLFLLRSFLIFIFAFPLGLVHRRIGRYCFTTHFSELFFSDHVNCGQRSWLCITTIFFCIWITVW